jgi:glycine/D-amino acid oxidase-like deaminating enzyme
MKNNQQKSILIIGGGLAGITLAHYLLKRKQQVTVIDDGKNASTRVAAGLVNPLVFRRTTLSWRAAEFLKEGWEFYKELEKTLNTPLAEPIRIKRVFPSSQERDEWIKKEDLEEFKSHLLKIPSSSNGQSFGIVKSGYVVHSENFYIKNHQYFDELGILKIEAFDYSSYSPSESCYQGIVYDHVVFCCGYRVFENPFFKDCQVKPTKGQMLIIRHEELPQTESLHLKCFVFPMGNKMFRVGATYEWDNVSLRPTKKGLDTLLSHLTHLTKVAPVVVSQPVGIRPTTMDRRPVLGSHPTFKNTHMFNGLGAKGYLIAPTMAKEMMQYLLDKRAIPKEYSITRHKTL